MSHQNAGKKKVGAPHLRRFRVVVFVVVVAVVVVTVFFPAASSSAAATAAALPPWPAHSTCLSFNLFVPYWVSSHICLFISFFFTLRPLSGCCCCCCCFWFIVVKRSSIGSLHRYYATEKRYFCFVLPKSSLEYRSGIRWVRALGIADRDDQRQPSEENQLHPVGWKWPSAIRTETIKRTWDKVRRNSKSMAKLTSAIKM